MSLAHAVGRNTIIQFVGKILSTILGLVTFAVIERHLGPTAFGGYTFVMAYLGTFSVIADLGLYILFVRELNRAGADQNKVVGNMLALRWTTALIILTIGAIIAWLMPVDNNVRWSVLIGSLSYVAIAATQLLVGVYQSRLAMMRVTTAELVGRLALLGATVGAVALGGQLRAIVAAVAIGSIVNFLIVWGTAWKYVSLRLRFDFQYWGYILRQVLPVTISVVLNLIYFRADTLLLQAFASQYDVGLYGAAYKILEILITFPIMFVGLLLPALTTAYTGNDRPRFIAIFQRGFELLLIAAVPIVTVGWIFAKEILVAIGSDGYAPAAPALRLLLIAVAAAFLNALSAHCVTVIGKQKSMMWSYLTVAVAGLTFYLIAIPRLGMIGAAYGTILTETLTMLIGQIVVLRTVGFSLRLHFLPKLFVATGLTIVAALLIHPYSFWLGLVTSAVVYGLAVVLLQIVPLSVIKDILRGRSEPASVTPPTL